MIHGGFPDVQRDLSVCLNPLGPPPEVREWWNKPTQVWMQYPEAYADKARHALAPHLRMDPDCLLLGNGCGELFALALRTLNIANAAIVRPCYGGYQESATLAGTPMRNLDLPVEIWGGERIPQADLEKSIFDAACSLGASYTGALFLANPNNPDGRLLPWSFIQSLAALIPHGWLFLDQSYMDFIELPDEQRGYRAPLHDLPHNVLVFQSFTKFFCLAGMRLAGVQGSLRTITRLRNLHLPWTVNGPAQEIARLLYINSNWLKSSRVAWKNSLNVIQHEWRALGVQPCQRQVPWLFGRLPDNQPGDSFLRDCLVQGTALRVFGQGAPGIENYVRIGLPVQIHDC